MTNEAKTAVQREAPVDESDGLAKYADAIETQVDAVSAALARTRIARLGIFLTFLILVCVIVYAFYPGPS